MQLPLAVTIDWVPSLEKESACKTLHYDVLDTEYGSIFVSLIQETLCSLQFIGQREVDTYVTEMQHQYPDYTMQRESVFVKRWLETVLKTRRLSVFLQGTTFQKRVWQVLLSIPEGKTVSYLDMACKLGLPTAQRAVANAIGKNPISYFVPCHRVIHKSGGLGGYRWGLPLKKRLLIAEGIAV